MPTDDRRTRLLGVTGEAGVHEVSGASSRDEVPA
jgi:hypothetical protein